MTRSAARPLVRAAVLAVGTAAVTLALPAGAANNRRVVEDGSIALGHYDWPPVAMFGAPCDPSSPLNGTDGVWYRIPSWATHVTMTPDVSLDADLYFYSSASGKKPVVSAQNNQLAGGNCRYLSGMFLNDQYASTGQWSVSGSVPAPASYLLVNGWIGTGAFTVEFSSGHQGP